MLGVEDAQETGGCSRCPGSDPSVQCTLAGLLTFGTATSLVAKIGELVRHQPNMLNHAGVRIHLGNNITRAATAGCILLLSPHCPAILTSVTILFHRSVRADWQGL